MILKDDTMRKITFAEKLDSKHLRFEFSTHETKTLDLDLILNYPVFSFLNDEKNISKFVVKGSYIEWTEFEADISADTIWHLCTPNV